MESLFEKLQKENRFLQSLIAPTIELSWKGLYPSQMSLTIDKRDHISGFSYQVHENSQDIPLYEALGEITLNKPIERVQFLGWEDFDQFFANDKKYLAYKNSSNCPLFTAPLQLFYACLAEYRGERYITQTPDSPLVCRCFGVLEKEILHYLQKSTSKEMNLKTLTGDILPEEDALAVAKT